jgi:hypothetical protein
LYSVADDTGERRRLTEALEPLQRSTSPFAEVPSEVAGVG